ncbi:PKD domain-containing protein [bacterium]|nr:PKD domain-containing protein [bacterium]
MVKKMVALFSVIMILGAAHLYALERPDIEFKIFQFPPTMIPCIDGRTDDWNIVPVSYVIGTDQLSDTVKDHEMKVDPKDLDIKVRVGWVKGLNRLYFLYEAYDDYWNMYFKRGDIFEVVVDGDLSGGQFINNEQLTTWEDNHFRFKGVHAQNYHIFTPPGEGRDWCMVWGCQPWIAELPYANHAYSYNFKEGESGKLVLEFWITPFDYAPYDGPSRAVESKLTENTIIGLSWSVLDYDENNSEYEGFWNLSHKTRMDSNASCQVAFRLMPLEPKFVPAIGAQWSFEVVDMDRRLVYFKDLSQGNITSWLWDFDDGTTSNEQNPVHQYEKAGDFVVVLTVEGPAGKAQRIKVRSVAVR